MCDVSIGRSKLRQPTVYIVYDGSVWSMWATVIVTKLFFSRLPVGYPDIQLTFCVNVRAYIELYSDSKNTTGIAREREVHLPRV